MTFRFSTGRDTMNRRIFRAAVTIGLATVVVKAGTTFKDLAVARFFGRNDHIDSFLFALMLPSFAITLVVGAVSAALVPVLVDTRQKDGVVAGQRLLSSVLVLTVVLLVAVAVLLGALAPLYLPYLAHNFSPEKRALTRDFIYLLTPWLVTSGTAMFVGYVLNSIEKFAAPALVPILTPVAILASMILWRRPVSGYSLAAGTVAGSLLEAGLLCWLIKRHELLGDIRWHGFGERVRAVMSQTGPMMAGCLLMGATPLVDQYMASMLAPGSVAALSYGSKVTTALFAIGATALSTAALPYFSKMTAAGDWLGCRHTLKRYSTLILAIGVPLTALLVVCSRPVIRLLFERGAFTASDTDVVSRVQAFYCLQIPFYALCVLFVRFISSVRRNDLLMYASSINLVVDITMNLILMRWFGVAGIALSTTIVMICSFTFLFLNARRLLSRQSMIDVSTVPATIGQ